LHSALKGRSGIQPFGSAQAEIGSLTNQASCVNIGK
jgi:hypothetical protein